MRLKINRREMLKCIVMGLALGGPGIVSACGIERTEKSRCGRSFGSQRKSPEQILNQDKVRIFDFAKQIDMAVLKRNGIFIDFGAADHFKYTLGKWLTGWGKDSEKDGVVFTEALASGSCLFFPRLGKKSLYLNIHLHPQKARSVSVYVNQSPLGRIDFPNSDWSLHQIKIPKAVLVPGENRLMFKWRGSVKNFSKEIAADIDYIYLAEDGGEFNASLLPRYSLAVEEDLICLRSGAALSYYLQIPKRDSKPMLGFLYRLENQAGAGKKAVGCLKIEAVLDESPHLFGGENEKYVLFKEAASVEDYRAREVDLRDFSGEVIRLDISFSSPEAKLIMAKSGIYVSGKKFNKAPAILRGPNRKSAKNVIFIMIDTLRADHLRCYRNKRMKTQVIDRIAGRGALFERFSSAEDWTKPSVATMFTGVYPLTHKAQESKTILSKKFKLISELLQEKGVKTGAFVSNAYISEPFGFNRGWDFYENYIIEGKRSEAEFVFERAGEWIKNNKDKRFFAYIHTIDPHVPYSPSEKFLKLYDDKPYNGSVQSELTHEQLEAFKVGRFKLNDRDRERVLALYDGEISYHDKCLGDFIQKLADEGMLKDTFVVVTSDHGEEFWEHGSVGHGHSLFQELVRVPLVLYWKDVVPTGLRVAENYDHSVIFPTILDAMNFEAPDYIEGKSVLPKIFGQDEPMPCAGFSSHKNNKMAVWSDRWKLQMHNFECLLYNLEEDKKCAFNLSRFRPVALRYMKTILSNFLGALDNNKDRVKIKIQELGWDDELKRQLMPRSGQ